MLPVLLIFAQVSPSPPCLPIRDEWIRAGDVAPAIAAFSRVPAETPLAHAPVPGVNRTISTAELRTFARRLSLDTGTLNPVCFAWPMRPLDPATVEAQLHAAWTDGPPLDIVELSRWPVPAGEMRFSRDQMQPVAGSRGTYLWRGAVHYGGQRKLPIWVKLRARGRSVVLVATRDLVVGEAPGADAVREQQTILTPNPAEHPSHFDQLAGKVMRTARKAGDTIRWSSLVDPPAVTAGETVSLELRSPVFVIRTAGRVERSGRAGDAVTVTNLSSGQRLLARVEGPGKVSIGSGRVTANRTKLQGGVE